ncbi:MAG TPA: hypothetical protein VIM28_11795 [Solirubrobacterales bacterium]
MPRYILKFRGADPPGDEVALIEGSAGIMIVDRVAGAFLVDASDEEVRALRERLPAWTVAPETTFPPPETF